jgi:hypothetical protein
MKVYQKIRKIRYMDLDLSCSEQLQLSYVHSYF